jgi:hypothetical protein
MLISKSLDKYSIYRFSLAFQCIDNARVFSELIRSRLLVLQVGTLD